VQSGGAMTFFFDVFLDKTRDDDDDDDEEKKHQ